MPEIVVSKYTHLTSCHTSPSIPAQRPPSQLGNDDLRRVVRMDIAELDLADQARSFRGRAEELVRTPSPRSVFVADHRVEMRADLVELLRQGQICEGIGGEWGSGWPGDLVRRRGDRAGIRVAGDSCSGSNVVTELSTSARVARRPSFEHSKTQTLTVTVAISLSSRKQISFRRLFNGLTSSLIAQMYWSPCFRLVASSLAG